MSVKSWLVGQAIRSIVGQMPFEEVRVSKWILAAVAALVALFAGITPGLDGGTLTLGAILAGVSAGLLAGVGKLYDPGSLIAVPRLLKALGLAVSAGVAQMSGAIVDGVISAGEWGGLAVTLFTVFWAKWSTPDKIVS